MNRKNQSSVSQISEEKSNLDGSSLRRKFQKAKNVDIDQYYEDEEIENKIKEQAQTLQSRYTETLMKSDKQYDNKFKESMKLKTVCVIKLKYFQTYDFLTELKLNKQNTKSLINIFGKFVYSFQIISEDEQTWIIRKCMKDTLSFIQDIEKLLKKDKESLSKIGIDVNYLKQNHNVEENQQKILDMLEIYFNKLFQLYESKLDDVLFNFFEISSIQMEKGKRFKQCYVLKKAGGRYTESTMMRCCSSMFNRKQMRWLIISEDGVLYSLGPKYGQTQIREMVLFDHGFRIGQSRLNLFYTKRKLLIENFTRQLEIRATTLWQKYDIIHSLEDAIQKCPYIQINRFLSFAPQRPPNSHCKFYIDGEQYYSDVYDCLLLAKEEVYITDWWLSPELHLKRPVTSTKNQDSRLDRVLQKIAEQGVKIYIIVYKEAFVLTLDSMHTKLSLEKLSNNIKVLRHPATLISLWSHHEKMIVIDQQVGFLGGLDLCYGRMDNAEHRLTDLNVEEFFPGIDYSNARIADFRNVRKFSTPLIDKHKIPRMPWHDISMRVIGEPVKDMTRHFIQYWNYVNFDLASVKEHELQFKPESSTKKAFNKVMRKIHKDDNKKQIKRKKIYKKNAKTLIEADQILEKQSDNKTPVNTFQKYLDQKEQYNHTFKKSNNNIKIYQKDQNKILKEDKIYINQVDTQSQCESISEDGQQMDDKDQHIKKMTNQYISKIQQSPQKDITNTNAKNSLNFLSNQDEENSDQISQQIQRNIQTKQENKEIVKEQDILSLTRKSKSLQQPQNYGCLVNQQKNDKIFNAISLNRISNTDDQTNKINKNQILDQNFLQVEALSPIRQSKLAPSIQQQLNKDNSILFKNLMMMINQQETQQDDEQETNNLNHLAIKKKFSEIQMTEMEKFEKDKLVEAKQRKSENINIKKQNEFQAKSQLHFKFNQNQRLAMEIMDAEVEDFTCSCQMVRSASSWSIGLDQKHQENSIQMAYLQLIEESQYYIYIENQFFISNTAGSPVQNVIATALVSKIKTAHQMKLPFKVVVVVPLLPAFEGGVEDTTGNVLRIQLHWEYHTISRGGGSIIEQLKREGIEPEDYIMFFGLRTHDFLNGAPVTEMVYVHSKLMIVDDKKVIMGSANINDRSMNGIRDSEIAMVVQDSKRIDGMMEGQGYPARKFAQNLRVKIWTEIFGLSSGEVKDPLNVQFWETIKQNSKRNTEIYRRVFAVYPDDTIENTQQIQKFNASAKPHLYNELKQQIIGFAVQFPMNFLSRQNLKFGYFEKENLAPVINFT